MLKRAMLALSVVISAFAAIAAHAQQSLPRYNDLYVNDFAGILNQTTEIQVTSVFRQLRENTSVEAVVVTIDTVKTYGPQYASVEDFATALFDEWGVGSADRNNGVMLLVAIDDRALRIEVGTSYENTLDSRMQGVIDEFILPEFHDERYNSGIADGVRAIARVIEEEVGPVTVSTPVTTTGTGGVVAQSATEAVVPTLAPASNTGRTTVHPSIRMPFYERWASDIIGWFEDVAELPIVVSLGTMGAGLAGAFMGFRRFLRMRPRRCPHCGQPMRRLSEYHEDEHLTEGQQWEESLGSVDYDVWLCDNDGIQQVYEYKNLFSGYKPCPQCNHATLSTNKRIVDHATTYSTGLRHVLQSCGHCNYKNEWEEVIPKKPQANEDEGNTWYSGSSSARSSSSRSSRGSGSSYGGGRSSGGGTSGKW